LLTPVAYIIRRRKPPLSIMIAAIMIGAMPLVVLAVLEILEPAR
jgi:hypothetical protein